MSESRSELHWRALRNPFQSGADPAEGASGRVSGRSSDIRTIITAGQVAMIITGAPNIGKTLLARTLQRQPSAGWTWRDELSDLRDFINLNRYYFLQIDLKPLEGIEPLSEMRRLFIEQCISSLRSLDVDQGEEYTGSRALRALLQNVFNRHPDAHCCFMLDAIERLQEPDLQQFDPSRLRTLQERSLKLLDDSGVIRLLADLLDEFPQFGAMLFLESQPISGIGNIYKNVSADLARFTTMLLQVFTREDTERYLAQRPEILGAGWERFLKDAGVDSLFTRSEQTWLYEQAGTHSNLLEQLCFLTFRAKQYNAITRNAWEEIDEQERAKLITQMNEYASAYLERTWKRVQQALQNSSQETQDEFSSFMRAHKQWSMQDDSEQYAWEKLSEALRYILRSEGVVRSDPFLPVEYPGAILRSYLEQRVREQHVATSPRLFQSSGQKELKIAIPGQSPAPVALSDIEYRLIKTLLETPQRCNDRQLMQSAWGHLIDRSVFTQRMHHLRKKLRKAANDEDIIENRYGGIYLLSHPEWLQM